MRLFSIFLAVTNAYPSVMWHGMGDRADSSGKKQYIEIMEISVKILKE